MHGEPLGDLGGNILGLPRRVSKAFPHCPDDESGSVPPGDEADDDASFEGGVSDDEDECEQVVGVRDEPPEAHRNRVRDKLREALTIKGWSCNRPARGDRAAHDPPDSQDTTVRALGTHADSALLHTL